MQTSRLGGSIEIGETAVAVIPIGWPSTQMLITLTVEATRLIALRKESESRSSPSVMPSRWGKAGGKATIFDRLPVSDSNSRR